MHDTIIGLHRDSGCLGSCFAEISDYSITLSSDGRDHLALELLKNLPGEDTLKDYQFRLTAHQVRELASLSVVGCSQIAFGRVNIFVYVHRN